MSKDIWKQPRYFQVQCEIFDVATEASIKVKDWKITEIDRREESV